MLVLFYHVSQHNVRNGTFVYTEISLQTGHAGNVCAILISFKTRVILIATAYMEGNGLTTTFMNGNDDSLEVFSYGNRESEMV
jgi:hypothetical protein